MVGERTGIVGFLGVHITKGWLPGAVSKTNRMPESSISGETHDVQISSGTCTTDSGEGARIIGFLRVDITKEGLPGAVGKANGMPELPVACQANNMQIGTSSRAADSGEGTGIIGFLRVHIAKGWLPGAISKANGVPESSISSKTHDMEIVTSSCTTDIGERTRVVRFLRVHIAKEG